MSFICGVCVRRKVNLTILMSQRDYRSKLYPSLPTLPALLLGGREEALHIHTTINLENLTCNIA